MKIARIESRILEIPVKKVVRTGIGAIDRIANVFVRIYTDDGIVGIGEAGPWPVVTETLADTRSAVDENFAPALIGADPVAIGFIHSKMDGLVHGCGCSKSALDMALYDVVGKALGQPVYMLLGGAHRTQFRLSKSLGSQVISHDVNEMESLLRDGIGTFKIKMGLLPPTEDLERARALRKLAGPITDIRLDYNQSLSMSEAVRVLERACEIEPTFIEQPLPRWNIDGLTHLSARISAPIAADESLFTVHDAFTLSTRAAAKVFCLKLSKHGGLYRTKIVAGIAEAAGINCHFSTMNETSLGCAATWNCRGGRHQLPFLYYERNKPRMCGDATLSC
ncbi:enolase C-terminal domain-like protein [Mesorhizobium sp. L103C131B0]|uniref:mandelate racemase/muconate lactonizing enzyme family protein n=1 Tax=Mesorhizobium sp. L103C131B0 TaxID=1287089 RepID=UPI0003D025DE|nr:enolase C-terminal domain-like protein [Mesorhizobium sp. L103C131B0]ESZ53667.1 hypothetical protein X729_30950 [Mesorhizobium sp. L103C131B0]